MKKELLLEHDVTVLKTPLVDIEIVDEANQNIHFDILKSWNVHHAICIDYEKNEYQEVTDYDEKVIHIPTASLVIGKTYYIKSSKPIAYRDSDERLFTYGITEGSQTFAISFPDPNDLQKSLPEYYGTDMEYCDFNEEESSGTKSVSFQLIDRKYDAIQIAAAWIWNIPKKRMLQYECGAEVFTWII